MTRGKDTKPRVRRPKLEVEDIRKAFANNGDKLLTNNYLGTKQVLIYKCGGCKKPRTTNFNNYSRGYRCRVCCIKSQIKTDSNKIQKIVLRTQHYSMTDVCEIFRWSYGEFQSYVKKGLLPAPSTKIGNSIKYYYTEKDLQTIRDAVYLEGDKL